MKAFLMYQNRDFDPEEILSPGAADLARDLELDILFRAMSDGDKFLFEAAKTAVLVSLRDPQAILYRQHLLSDCLEQPEIVREIYGIAVEALEREKKVWGWLSERYPEGTLSRCIQVLRIFLELLKKLRLIAEEKGFKFRSEGFARLFDMIVRELDDDYLEIIEAQLQQLEFRKGILMSAKLGKGNVGINYALHRRQDAKLSWLERLQDWFERLTGQNGSQYFYEIPDRDEAGFNALKEIREQAVCAVSAALAQSTDHISNFFGMLRLELAFYVGCLNLQDQLVRKAEPICIPETLPCGKPEFSCRGLYDVCLSLSTNESVVGNDVAADNKALLIITGANRGGKSTFLRSAGLAQLMMQCGMFVAAESLRANICNGVFTHFKREEDATMKSGKLDEELSRMSSIIKTITPNSIVLLNESFASTNEREGSEIASQIVRAMLEAGIKVIYVTHMFDLAHQFYVATMATALFLRAERLADGRRTFRLIEGEPLPTSYGEDLYRRIFNPTSDNGLIRASRAP